MVEEESALNHKRVEKNKRKEKNRNNINEKSKRPSEGNLRFGNEASFWRQFRIFESFEEKSAPSGNVLPEANGRLQIVTAFLAIAYRSKRGVIH